MKYKTKSFLRRAEYDRLSRVRIDGTLLDVGGSKKSGYLELIAGDHTVTVGNIDASYGIDVEFDAQEPWPFPDASFDAVLLMNLLEHLYKYEVAVQEAYRVLKPGGRVIGVVPFMFNVHGSPSDYFRFTRFNLERLFVEAGFTECTIEELGSGAFSVVYHVMLGFVRWNWLADILIPFFRGLDSFVLRLKPNNKMSAKHMPLGYYFEAVRRS